MARSSNPFIAAAEASTTDIPEESVLHDPLLGHALMESGPSDPSTLPIGPEDAPERPWTFVQMSEVPASRIVVMGLHGGAGASTVAELLGEDAGESGQAWPIPPEGETLGVLAVCRSHWRGLQAADIFTRQWAAELLEGSTLLGLVIVDDGPQLADGQKRTVRRLLKRTPKGVHIPWVEAWRHASPSQGRIPARINRITRALHRAAASL